MTEALQALRSNVMLATMLLSILCAQLLKPLVYWLRTRRWDWTLLWNASGMPSSHSAAVAGVAMRIGLVEGFDSTIFGVVSLLALIVMYDARGVRRAAGEQAEALNYLLDLGAPIDEHKKREILEQRLGHTTKQVIGGAILGMLVALMLEVTIG